MDYQETITYLESLETDVSDIQKKIEKIFIETDEKPIEILELKISAIGEQFGFLPCKEFKEFKQDFLLLENEGLDRPNAIAQSAIIAHDEREVYCEPAIIDLQIEVCNQITELKKEKRLEKQIEKRRELEAGLTILFLKLSHNKSQHHTIHNQMANAI